MFSAFVLLFLAAAIRDFGLVEGKLEHLALTYRSQEHNAVDYDDKLTIAGIPDEKGGITQAGKNRAYKLGQDLAVQYGPQLGIQGNFKDEDFWTFGTKSKRTRVAALVLGSGLKNEDHGNIKHFLSKEVEAATYPDTEDFMKFTYPNQCPGFFKLLAGKEADFKNIVGKYQSALSAVAEKYPAVTAAPYLAWPAYETFLAQKHDNVTLDSKIEAVLGDLKKLSQEILFVLESSDDLKRLSGGRILDDIMNDLEARTKGEAIKNVPAGKDASKIRATFFGSSQGLVAVQLAAFNPTGTTYGGKALTAETFYPGHGSLHTVELHNEDGKYKVKVLYKQNDESQNLVAKFPGCDAELCDFETFKQAVQKLRLSKADQATACSN